MIANNNCFTLFQIFEARRQKTKKLKVYFLAYTESVEEQSYLTSLRREKQAFEHLIETKSVRNVCYCPTAIYML